MALKSISVLFILTKLSSTQCWILTDINPRSIEENFLDFEDELTPEDLARLRFNLIYPGTKWCGPGNIAEDYDDLGTSYKADTCCREHDNCPEYIAAGDTKYNLTNNSYFTRLSCQCDEDFRQCLQNAETKTAKTIGLVYFNVIGTKCFRKDYKIIGCNKKGGWLNSKCLDYIYDTNSNKTYQWFDVANFESNKNATHTRR